MRQWDFLRQGLVRIQKDFGRAAQSTGYSCKNVKNAENYVGQRDISARIV